MALRAKINGKLRTVSPALARRLRAKGIAVEGDKAPAAPAPRPLPVKKLDEVLPVETVPVTPVETAKIEPIDVLTDLVQQKLADAGVPAQVDMKSFHDAADKLTSGFDLSDEELERLTKPEA